MTLLPTFWGRAGSEHLLFPANGPLWSLFFELLINVVWAIGFARRSIASLFLVLTASALFLVSEIHTAGTGNLGMNRATFCGGLARVTFGFTAGVLIYRFRSSIRVPQIAAGNWILVACLSIIMTFPATIFFRQEHYDLVCAVIIMPVIVLAGISQDSLGRVGRLSGELSYPLYALHYPVLSIVSGLHQTELSWMAPYKLSVMAVVMSLLASWLALTLYDKPLHGFLERIIMFRASAADGTFTDNRKRRAISSAGQSDMRPQLE
jgi:peptidoglycan/LPS O-acetylase OafA/YrhL